MLDTGVSGLLGSISYRRVVWTPILCYKKKRLHFPRHILLKSPFAFRSTRSLLSLALSFSIHHARYLERFASNEFIHLDALIARLKPLIITTLSPPPQQNKKQPPKMRTSLATLLALATPLLAIKITSPTKNTVIDPSKGITIEWSTVNTDPSSAHLLLVNMVGGHTPFTKDLGEIDLSAGHITVAVTDVPADSGYQFNFVSVEDQNTGILAQSAQFRVKASSDSSSSASSSGGVKTSAATQSVTHSGHSGHATGTATDVTTLTGTATTGTALSTSATGTGTGGADATKTTGTAGASSSSTGGAAVPTGMVARAGGMAALVAGVAVVLA